MDIILAIISSVTAIVVTWIKSSQSKDSPKIEDIGKKLFIFKEKTNGSLDVITTVVKEIRDDINGLNRSVSNLKREIQDIHISHAKINPEEVKQNFGRVILLEEKSRVFERMHLKTAEEINKIKKAKEGG